jgi:hypothetical protein
MTMRVSSEKNMIKGHLVKALVVAVIFFMAVAGKVFYMQRSHYIAAEKYFAASDWKSSIREYDAAMHSYIPWSPYIARSAGRLWEIGGMFEGQGKLEWANDAYSSIRSSFYASRSLYTPGKDWIARCDEKIADIDVKLLIKDGSVKPEDAAAEKEKLLYVMRTDRAPIPLWSVCVEIGFFGWIASVVFIALKGFDDKGKIKGKFIFYGTLSFILTFALWVIGMLKA